jgi:hypothetical protein
MFEDDDAEVAFQVHFGYCFTGETIERHFLQLSSAPRSGKTSFVAALGSAMGAYASIGKSPVSEISAAYEFEDDFGKQCALHPSPRVVVWDETRANVELKEELINQCASGNPNIQLALKQKHRSASQIYMFHAKIVISSNHVLTVKAGSVGTVDRIRAPPFKCYFPIKYEIGMPDGARPADPELVRFITSPEARAGIAAYLAEGAKMYYVNRFPASAAWEVKRLSLIIAGDPYLSWIAATYAPTGSESDRCVFSQMLELFNNGKVSATAKDGLRTALQSLSEVVTAVSWNVSRPYYGAGPVPDDHPVDLVYGYQGLRVRKLNDPPFSEGMEFAKAQIREARRVEIEA